MQLNSVRVCLEGVGVGNLSGQRLELSQGRQKDRRLQALLDLGPGEIFMEVDEQSQADVVDDHFVFDEAEAYEGVIDSGMKVDYSIWVDELVSPLQILRRCDSNNLILLL
jgi:hypothetical protein